MFETLHENLWAWYELLDDDAFKKQNNKNSVRFVITCIWLNWSVMKMRV